MVTSLAELSAEVAQLAAQLARVESRLQELAAGNGNENRSMGAYYGQFAGPPFTSEEDIAASKLKLDRHLDRG